MKKIIVAIAASLITVGAVYSQGTIAVYSISSTFSMYTNNAAYSAAKNGVLDITGGKTATAANGFYYALLFQPYNAGLTAINPLDSNYALGMNATNFGVAGGIRGVGAASGGAVTGWAEPTDGSYLTAERNNFLLVGWSASVGTNWAQVSAELTANSWIANGFFGVSALGNSYAGAGPNSLSAVSIFGVTANAPGGLANGITLFSVTAGGGPVPEPSTMALAALGGASLLLFRRRK